MTWNYKAHSLLVSVLKRRLNLAEFLLNLSWTYAHYVNGEGPRHCYINEEGQECWKKRVKWAWRITRPGYDDDF